jgi:hypothetical protein
MPEHARIGIPTMIYLLSALLPPLGLLLNGQPFSALFNLVLIAFCLVFALFFHVLLLVPSAHALLVVHLKREERACIGRWWRRSANMACGGVIRTRA